MRPSRHPDPEAQLVKLFADLLRHDGYGSMKVKVRLLKRGQKEVVLHCGRQYRYVVDFEPPPP